MYVFMNFMHDNRMSTSAFMYMYVCLHAFMNMWICVSYYRRQKFDAKPLHGAREPGKFRSFAYTHIHTHIHTALGTSHTCMNTYM
jgi:hypothetical protein